jgi:sirohydrochlorin ferrochelatase
MKCLLLVAHGSRRSASNDEIRKLATKLSARAAGSFDEVSCAFLEIAQPSIQEGIQQLIDRGAHEVVVLPYFLSAGRHVAEDIPREVRAKQAEHPGVAVRIAPYLGAAEHVPELLLALAEG